ncbi:MAG TPA: hypothetical protein VFT45_03890 [Longimicrobium sp.]|nr:hypothetical protein [Longimicrobium sp.]
MRKIRLHLESITVESFQTTAPDPAAGTVAAHQQISDGGTCENTCGRSCPQTCPASCDATCVTCLSNCQPCLTPGCPGNSGYRCTDPTCYWPGC